MKIAGSFAELEIPNGVKSLHCPITGMPVMTEEDGFDESAEHSPHLRFVVDWIGGIWIADQENLKDGARISVSKITETFSSAGEDESINDTIAKVCDILPSSALIMELLEPARGGGHQSSVFYACFDFAQSHGELQSVRLTEC